MPGSATELFQQHFGRAPAHVAQAPGRLELLGNHTDYNGGLVLALAVDRNIQIAAAPREDGRVRLVAAAFPGVEEFSVAALERSVAAPWADYVKGVLQQLQRHGAVLGGFDAAVVGTIPMGAGMSSSAALEVATALIVRQLNPYEAVDGSLRTCAPGAVPSPLGPRERLALAKLCQAAENEFVGVKCGLLDQMSSLFGRAEHALELDFQSLEVSYAPLPAGIAVVVCNSGVKHELVGGEYNELRACCEAAARQLEVPLLRQATPDMLAAGRSRLSQREFQCASHIIGENTRVESGVRALRAGDFAAFGRLMFQSHASSRDDFHNSTAELDLLVEIARAHPACLGARLTGGGFGGATINLVRREGLAGFNEHMAREYPLRGGPALVPLVCRVADGAS